LKDNGANVWVDRGVIQAADSLPDRISDALEWCSIFLLVWSKASGKSRWVKLEWANAIALDKKIIPCILDSAELPGILSNLMYVNMQDFEQGIRQLKQTLNLIKWQERPISYQIQILQPGQLRSQPLDNLSSNHFVEIFKKWGVF